MKLVLNRFTRHSRIGCVLAGVALVSACSKGEKTPGGAGAVNPPASNSSPATDMAAGPISMATGNPDHDFLRMMSDHHQGLISIVHMTVDRKDGGSAVGDAKKLDDAQDKELDQMVTMLEKDYKDPYEPKIMPEHQAMVDDLKTKSGKNYERGFYEDIIKHHEEAIKMIDAYMTNAKSASVKQMAASMKAAQSREISDFKAKVAKLGS